MKTIHKKSKWADVLVTVLLAIGVSTANAGVPSFTTYTYARAGGVELQGDFHSPSSPRRGNPVVVWAHGGGVNRRKPKGGRLRSQAGQPNHL